MQLNRRKFIGYSAGAAGAAPVADERIVLERAGLRAVANGTGALVSLTKDGLELIGQRPRWQHPRVIFLASRILVCDRPAKLQCAPDAVVFAYEFEDPVRLRVEYALRIADLGPVPALQQRISITPRGGSPGGIMLQIPLTAALPVRRREVFLPLYNGVGRTREVEGMENDDEYIYRFAGEARGGKGQLLSIPLVDEFSSDSKLRIAYFTDPRFSSYFKLPYSGQAGQFHCIYPRNPGIRGTEKRTLTLAPHDGGFDESMRLFYEAEVSEIRPGPDWLHSVAMVGYDYLSKNGRGWFSDVDVLAEAVEPKDRGKVVLALHGWYDYVGRYCFDDKTRSLDKEWLAFPNALHPAVQQRGDAPDLGERVRFHKKSAVAMKPVRMTLADLHRRILHARRKGFRVVLYYGDGMGASATSDSPEDPEGRILKWGGWRGPDTLGRIYQQNPLLPSIRDFFVHYLDALLEEFGRELDGLVWDETFAVETGTIGPPRAPGYADRAMMELVAELTKRVQAFDPRLAFLTSDNIGFKRLIQHAPYCLMSHGTYQDSHCRPEVWPYGFFPNYRNVIWSCNWAPVSAFHFTRYGVEMFDTPVAIANGPFGDDTGVSDMTREQLGAIMELFSSRKSRPMRIRWIEETRDLRYGGRRLAYTAGI